MESQSIDVVAIISALKPIVALIGALLTSGVVVTIATQVSKMDFIPWNAAKYPRLTAAVYSFLAAIVAVATSDSVDLLINSWYGLVGFALAVLLLSANAYRSIVKDTVLDVDSGKSVKSVL